MIDKKFNHQNEEINAELEQWKTLKNKDEIEEHFSKVFAKYQALREYINMYTFAIPATFFSLYQTKMDLFVETYNKQKDVALPKKKFTFAKK